MSQENLFCGTPSAARRAVDVAAKPLTTSVVKSIWIERGEGGVVFERQSNDF
jgi:hypothetical protein